VLGFELRASPEQRLNVGHRRARKKRSDVPHSRIVVVGASAGGFEAVRTVLGGLPDDFPAAVLVVIHTGPNGILPEALARDLRLRVAAATDGERLNRARHRPEGAQREDQRTSGEGGSPEPPPRLMAIICPSRGGRE
jgi:CheB methylesterase